MVTNNGSVSYVEILWTYIKIVNYQFT